MSTTIRLPGLLSTEHEFSVPLDHDKPEGDLITVFVREVADPEGRDRPYLVFLQGGPGNEAPRPTGQPLSPGWLERALQDFRVLMLDQRGTGRSTPVGALTDLRPEQQADYLANFRADSIVRDAEWIRRDMGVDRWSVLGQSFGGFCATTYLSIAPQGLSEVMLTGGLPPIDRSIDDVYRLTYQRVLDRNRQYFARYPDDLRRVQEIQARLQTDEVVLAGGDRLTVRRFRQLGILLGMSDGAERLHYIVELPVDSPGFLHDVDSALNFSRTPLYAILQEACYANGESTRWAAERLMPADYEDSILFTGEHVYPWMFDEYSTLVPMKHGSELLASREWPRLYDAGVLARNDVPAAAAIYAEDMYVDRELSEESASMVRSLKPWVTNEYEHNGLRADGNRILGRLIDLVRGWA